MNINVDDRRATRYLPLLLGGSGAILSKVSDIKKEDMIGVISSFFVKTGKSIFNTLYLAMLSVSP